MRCKTAIVDEPKWYQHWRGFFLARAKVVQLWHGVGYKRIESDLWTTELRQALPRLAPVMRSLLLNAYKFTRRWPRYALVATTSRFYRDSVFRPAFRSDCFPVTGYPRNSFAQSLTDSNRELAWANGDSGIRDKLSGWKKQGRKIVLLAPTFLAPDVAPFGLDESTLTSLDGFAEEAGAEFIFKFHPLQPGTGKITGKHVHTCDPTSDIYPVLPFTAALVTNHSSIYMDYLLLDRPVLFFDPGGRNEAGRWRFQFNPRSMMPGPFVSNWRELLTALESQWRADSHTSERNVLCGKAFDGLPQADAAPRILTTMREKGWLRDPGQTNYRV